MRHVILVFLFFLFGSVLFAQSRVDSVFMYSDVKITLDAPANFNDINETVLIIYALPNGNSTAQTMGKKIKEGDDWHFDIQHIKAQTLFLRRVLSENIVVAYLENNYKSWPTWKQKHNDSRQKIKNIVDSLSSLFVNKLKSVYLNGHSGGGSFIFGYLDAIDEIPSIISRISFIDSNYGYDSSYYNKLYKWLKKNKNSVLSVFAYNDSVALYKGKPVVSATGGTWYKSHLMLHQIEQDFKMVKIRDDSLVVHIDKKKRIGFYFKTNPSQKIFHTQQVELNGFIHSILFGTKYDSKDYQYFGPRAYENLIL